MSDFTSPWQGYDFSGLSAALSRIQEISRPALEALQNIQSTLQPIVEALEQYKPKVAEIGQALLQASRRFSAIRKMGDAQFVFWDYMTEEYVDAKDPANSAHMPMGIPAYFIADTSRLLLPAPATQDTLRRSRQKTS